MHLQNRRDKRGAWHSLNVNANFHIAIWVHTVHRKLCQGVHFIISMTDLKSNMSFIDQQSKAVTQQRLGRKATAAIQLTDVMRSVFIPQHLCRLSKQLKDVRGWWTEYWQVLEDDFVNSWWALTCQASQQPLALLFSPPYMSKLNKLQPPDLFTHFTVAPFFPD